MQTLNSRQTRILEFLKINSPQSATTIQNYLVGVSRATLNRDLNLLLKESNIYKQGKSKNTVYLISLGYTYTKPYSISYFYQPPSTRITSPDYNLNITTDLSTIEIFTDQELNHLQALTHQHQNNLNKIDPTIFKKEIERITIELSWMSSKIEGNTYSLIETELLIEKNKTEGNHTKDETQMILNHKDAVNHITSHAQDFLKISSSKILNIHSILSKNLYPTEYRNHPTGITGTLYRPLFQKKAIKNELKKITQLINSKSSPFEKSLLINLLIAYLQPFPDGNKRTSRITGNALLMANHCAPLSLLTLDEKEYKRAILLFYEQNNISLFKQIFLEQYQFAVENYFLT